MIKYGYTREKYPVAILFKEGGVMPSGMVAEKNRASFSIETFTNVLQKKSYL